MNDELGEKYKDKIVAYLGLNWAKKYLKLLGRDSNQVPFQRYMLLLW
jgi:hypothetical protein